MVYLNERVTTFTRKSCKIKNHNVFSLHSISIPFFNTHTCSYHQKHYLRVQPDVFQELQLSDRELFTSTLAAQLNGYCGGYGTLKDFQRDALSFNISQAAAERVRKLITKGPGTDDDQTSIYNIL